MPHHTPCQMRGQRECVSQQGGQGADGTATPHVGACPSKGAKGCPSGGAKGQTDCHTTRRCRERQCVFQQGNQGAAGCCSNRRGFPTHPKPQQPNRTRTRGRSPSRRSPRCRCRGSSSSPPKEQRVGFGRGERSGLGMRGGNKRGLESGRNWE